MTFANYKAAVLPNPASTVLVATPTQAVWSLFRGAAVALIVIIIGYVALFVIHHAGLMSEGINHWINVYGKQYAGYGFWAITVLAAPFFFLRNFDSHAKDSHGSARFASMAETTPLLSPAPTNAIIGREPLTGKLLHYNGNGHLLTMAPTRTGKGVGTVIPNLLKRNGPVICIDPKGENVAATAAIRAKRGPVHVLDPFGITHTPGAAYNPLAELDPRHPDLAEEVAELADALVSDPPDQTNEAHWNEEAKALIAGILLYVVTQEAIANRTLDTLRDYLTCAPTDFLVLLSAMQETDAANGLVRRAANRHLGKSDREAAGVLSSAQRHTHFLDSQRMTTTMGHSDFSFQDLKRGPMTVYLVLPPDRLATYSRWLRLMIVQSMQALARGDSPTQPILYLLDEFAALGHLASIERAMGLMAGYGVQLWPILQDLHQLRSLYGKRADTFMANASVLQVFGVNDHETARLVSDLLGQETVVFETDSASTSRSATGSSSSTSTSESRTARALLTPDEIRTMASDDQLLFLSGMRPIHARKIRYYEEPDFIG